MLHKPDVTVYLEMFKVLVEKAKIAEDELEPYVPLKESIELMDLVMNSRY
nr:hypothetical protein [Candidatus Njordarchaeota archaeon]